MNVYFDEKLTDQIRGDVIAQFVQRSDLAPVPRTLELVLKNIDGMSAKVKEGAFLWAGREVLKYRIVKVEPIKKGLVQGQQQMGAVKVIALLDSCAEIAFRRARAVVRENASLGDVYRACGANAAIINDFNVKRFACLVGDVPSFALAQAMQEECAALVLSNKKLSIVRLPDLFKQKPIRIIASDPTDSVESEFIERHEIPSFISTNAAGAVVKGNFDKTRAVAFQPRSDVRVLNNMTRVLVTRKVMKTELATEADAGQIMSIGGVPLVIITAAHVFEEAGGTVNSYSKLWLGGLSV